MGGGSCGEEREMGFIIESILYLYYSLCGHGAISGTDRNGFWTRASSTPGHQVITE